MIRKDKRSLAKAQQEEAPGLQGRQARLVEPPRLGIDAQRFQFKDKFEAAMYFKSRDLDAELCRLYETFR